MANRKGKQEKRLSLHAWLLIRHLVKTCELPEWMPFWDNNLEEESDWLWVDAMVELKNAGYLIFCGGHSHDDFWEDGCIITRKAIEVVGIKG